MIYEIKLREVLNYLASSPHWTSLITFSCKLRTRACLGLTPLGITLIHSINKNNFIQYKMLESALFHHFCFQSWHESLWLARLQTIHHEVQFQYPDLEILTC